jgi:hypothetical protein
MLRPHGHTSQGRKQDTSANGGGTNDSVLPHLANFSGPKSDGGL